MMITQRAWHKKRKKLYSVFAINYINSEVICSDYIERLDAMNDAKVSRFKMEFRKLRFEFKDLYIMNSIGLPDDERVAIYEYDIIKQDDTFGIVKYEPPYFYLAGAVPYKPKSDKIRSNSHKQILGTIFEQDPALLILKSMRKENLNYTDFSAEDEQNITTEMNKIRSHFGLENNILNVSDEYRHMEKLHINSHV